MVGFVLGGLITLGFVGYLAHARRQQWILAKAMETPEELEARQKG